MKVCRVFLALTFLLCLGLISCNLQDKGSQFTDTTTQDFRYFPASVLPDRIMQSASADPSSEIRISWRTSGEIDYGFIEFIENTGAVEITKNALRTPAELVTVQFDDFRDHYFRAVLSELMPSTDYLLRVGNSEFRSEWFNVKTTSENFEPFTFLYFGDVQNEIREFGSRVFRQAEYQFPDARFMVHAGDLVLSSGNDDTWGEWFYSGDKFFQKIPSIVTAGNSDHHRWKSEPVDSRLLFPQWHGVFNLPDNGPDQLKNLSYYVDYPGLRIISFYTNFVSVEDDRDIFVAEDMKIDLKLFDDQLRWLNKTMSKNTQPWLVMLLHHPVFSARDNRVNPLIQENLLPLFEKYDVDLVLQGHDHVYARGFNPNGPNTSQLPVFMINMSGGKMAKGDPDQDWILKYLENKQLFSAVEVNTTAMIVKTYDTTGKLWDEFRIEHRDNKAKHLVEVEE